MILTSSINPDDRERAKVYNDVKDFHNKYINKEELIKILKKYFPAHF